MVSVTFDIKEKAVNRRVRITAASIERALELAGEGKPGKEVCMVFPIDPEAFFVGSGASPGLVEAA